MRAKYTKPTGALKKLAKKIIYYLDNDMFLGFPSEVSNPQNYQKAMWRVKNVRKTVR